LGIAGFIIGIVQIKSNSDVWDVSSYNWQKGTGVALVVFSVFLVVSGAFGLTGALRKSKCLLLFYDIFNVPLFIALLTIGIVALAATTFAANDLDDAKTTCAGDGLDWLTNSD